MTTHKTFVLVMIVGGVCLTLISCVNQDPASGLRDQGAAVDPVAADGIGVAYSFNGLDFTWVGEVIVPDRFVSSVVHDTAHDEYKIYHLPTPGSEFPADARQGSWIYVTGITSLKLDGTYELAPGTDSAVGRQVWVDGVDPNQWNAEDPSVTLLSDGSYLLHYFENEFGPVDPMCFADSSEFVISIATSSNGVDFTKQGVALQYQKLEPIPQPDTCEFRILEHDQAHG